MRQIQNQIKIKRTLKQNILDIMIMFAGATLVAFGTAYIFDPAGLDTGGVSGLSVIIRELSGRYLGYEIPLWLSNVILNVPIFLLAWKTFGFRSLIRTGFVWLVMTVELFFFPGRRLISDNLLLTSIYGGIVFGAGVGLLINARATSGGTDLLGYALHRYIRHISIGRLIQFLDGAIVLLGAAVFGLERTLYAVISVFIMGRVTDYIINTGRSAKMAMIISKKNDLIATDILERLDRGVTGLRGRGMYTGKDRIVLICICTKRDIVFIKDIVREYDKNAFVVVADVAEALGEGFAEDWN